MESWRALALIILGSVLRALGAVLARVGIAQVALGQDGGVNVFAALKVGGRCSENQLVLHHRGSCTGRNAGLEEILLDPIR